MVKALDTISPIEFASTFVSSIREQEQRFTWFFGAGCSYSSGIPTAGGLVEKWLGELRQNGKLNKSNFDAWVQAEFPGFDPAAPSKHYAQVFRRRHRAADAQQREIEQICARSEASYGYATFAQILSLKEFGKRCNTILTTNFDDLVADALHMYGDREMRPQTITHEALARYVRTGSPRPTIIKLHGDAHLSPKNMREQTKRLDDGITKVVQEIIRDSAIVFVGYGGNDESITYFFEKCPATELAPQVYWVGKHDPGPALHEWLLKRDAVRVDHTDFDKLMHHLRGSLELRHPEATRWERNYRRYLEQYRAFEVEVKAEPESDEKAALGQASIDVSNSLPSGWDYYFKVLESRSSDEKEALYREGIEKHPKSAHLAGMFAVFLKERGNFDEAEIFFKRAIEINPADANALGNYAVFLGDDRKDLDAAESVYRRAIEMNPSHADNLGNYAVFLADDRGDPDAAETFYKRAIEVDPRSANTLGNYANFLRARKEMDNAEEFFRRAIDADPKNATNLGNYANFLREVRHDADLAESLYKLAIDADPKNANNLENYATFLQDARHNADMAENFYKRAIDAEPQEADLLGNYANFLRLVRKDLDRAQNFYLRALASDPKHARSLGNYAQHLFATGRDAEGLDMVRQALSLTSDTLVLSQLLFYQFARDDAVHRNQALKQLRSVVAAGGRSKDWDFSADIAAARALGHPQVDLLVDLAKVISEDAPISTLESHEAWRAG